jgi:hypothetical protein
VQVKAISRSGTNAFSGLFRANFRDDAFNVEDPVVKEVLPMQNQQFSTAIGGPIIRDRLHCFGSFGRTNSQAGVIRASCRSA